jgi:hypothetical protein
MKALTRCALVALVVAGALAVIAPPAFATGLNTGSVNNVGPFFTPIGNTDNSSSTFIGPRVDFSGVTRGGAGVTVTCESGMSGYVPNTHTRVLITDLAYNGCISNIGNVSFALSDATSANPYTLHVTSTFGGVANSWSTTLNIPMGQRISINITLGGGRFCGITIGPQSIKATDTDAGRTLVFADPTVRFILDAGSDVVNCPDPARNLTLTGTYGFRPDTPADPFRSTLGSMP